ncbi:MAG: ABC transporter permease [Chitinophagaceae bacterium]|nr:MAG: ABC transporter permease [Chitinophagaceae bacterium]
MHKTWLIIQREYLSRVKKKSFIILTLLVPLIIAAFIGIQIFLVTGGNKETQHIAVIDESGMFSGKLKDGQQLFFTFLGDKSPQTFVTQYEKTGYNGLLVIPRFDLNNPDGFVYYSKHQLGLGPYAYITGRLNNVIEDQRMIAAGIDKEKLAGVKADVSLLQPGAGASGQSKDNTGYATYASTAVGYICGFFIYFILLIYGTQVMRGVAEEKTNRIAEVLVSSVKPFQMMIGKVVGIAGVGLTQFLIWIFLGLMVFFALGSLAPSLAHQAGNLQQMQQMGSAGNARIAEAMSKVQDVILLLPVTEIILCFLFYFLGGYLLYAALFAAVGSAVDQDMTESQALTLPITMPLVISFLIMFNAIQQPNSPLAVFCSIFPVSSPLVMMARIPFGVPWWQLALSILLLIVGILLTIWIAGKIYRTGILMYGKKVTLKELGRWAFRKE